MTSGDNNPAPARRFSTAVVLLAGVVGLVIGAIAAFAVTGLVWTVRVQLPPPPYPPQLSLAPQPGCVSPPPPAAGTPPAPTPAGTPPAPTPGGLPVPPLPPQR
jgi:hypothetical protein